MRTRSLRRQTADDGRQTTDDGRQTTDGARQMAHGARRTADVRRWTADGRRRITSFSRPRARGRVGEGAFTKGEPFLKTLIRKPSPAASRGQCEDCRRRKPAPIPRLILGTGGRPVCHPKQTRKSLEHVSFRPCSAARARVASAPDRLTVHVDKTSGNALRAGYRRWAGRPSSPGMAIPVCAPEVPRGLTSSTGASSANRSQHIVWRHSSSPAPSSRGEAEGTPAAAACVLAAATFVPQTSNVAGGQRRKVGSRQEFLPLRVWMRGSGGSLMANDAERSTARSRLTSCHSNHPCSPLPALVPGEGLGVRAARRNEPGVTYVNKKVASQAPPPQPSPVCGGGRRPASRSAVLRPPSPVCQLPSAVRHPPSAVRHPPSAVCRPPSPVCRPPSAVCRPRSAVPFLPSAVRRLPSRSASQ